MKNVEPSQPRSDLSSSRAPEIVFQHVTHKLRLQPLRAELAANMQSSLSSRQFLVPGGQTENRPAELSEGGPHQPPTVSRSFQQSAIRPSATVQSVSRFHFSVKPYGIHFDRHSSLSLPFVQPCMGRNGLPFLRRPSYVRGTTGVGLPGLPRSSPTEINQARLTFELRSGWTT